MKKFGYLILAIILFFTCNDIYASEKYNVKLSKCVDGDTARFILKKEEIKARFLAIDTPESVHPTKEVQPFGKEASEYTCNKLKNAKEIMIEYDPDSDKTDKYKRHLVWVYVDNKLLQEDLIEQGYAKVAYLYGKYQYTDDLKKVESIAKESKKGIWSVQQSTEDNKSSSKSTKSTKTSKKKKNKDSIIDQIINALCEILEKIVQNLLKFVTDMV